MNSATVERMDRLTEITFCLPTTTESRAFLYELRLLLAEVPYAESAPSGGLSDGVVDPLTTSAPTAGMSDATVDRLILTPPRPVGALPVTAIELADVSMPGVVLDTGLSLGVWSDGTHDSSARVEMADLTQRLAGHVRRVDHTGVNLPADATSAEQWRSLVSALASTSTMYRYPEGEEWPFVLPSTSGELRDDIRDFVVGREPRFELVYDESLVRTEWQFALWTDLTRAELELMFPEPEGITFPGLDDIFRVVEVQHPWPGLGIRFDLCYRIEDSPSDWETGEWLVTEGGRIR